MMKLTLLASWKDSSYDYVIGSIQVKDEEGSIIMEDTDMYYNYLKFVEKTVVKKFRYNPRFKWIKAVYHRDSNTLEVIMEDAGKGHMHKETTAFDKR